jgi:hypothetical protein
MCPVCGYDQLDEPPGQYTRLPAGWNPYRQVVGAGLAHKATSRATSRSSITQQGDMLTDVIVELSSVA